MGLLDRLLGGKLPGWAKTSPHDAKSAAALVEAIQRYVLENGGSIELGEETAKVCGPRGERVVKLGDFVFICPADSPETWSKMIAHVLRDVIPEAAVVAEVRTSIEKLLRDHQPELEAVAGDHERAQAHLRMVLRVRGFRPEVPDLIRVVKRDAFDRFEAVAVYDFLPLAEGLPASHLASWGLDGSAVLARAQENTLAAEVQSSGERVASFWGAFAGSRVLAPERFSDGGELGLLMAAPHQDLCLFHAIEDSAVMDALGEMMRAIHRHQDGGPAGGTGRSLFWWRKGVFQEIPTSSKAVLRDGADPYEYRLTDRFKRDVLRPLGIEEG